MSRDPFDISSDRRRSTSLSKSSRSLKYLIDGAYIQEDRRRHDRDDGSRRRHERAQVNADATLRAPARVGVDARVHNLSAGGCCLELQFGSFQLGEAVWFKVEGVESWKGTVRWIDAGRVGVEFDHPFFPAVFDQMISLNNPVALERVA